MPFENNADVTLRQKIDRFINDARTEFVVAILIILSVGLLLTEAAAAPGWQHFDAVVLANDLITWTFVVELTLRYIAERKKRRFFRRYWIDVIAVMPLFRGLRILRVLSLLRLFRVGIILGRHLRFFSRTFSFVKIEYIAIVFAIVVSILMGALSMRFAEGRTNDDFSNFEEAVWFSVMTIVGAEPIGGQPTSRLGRMVTLTLMMGGLTVFAIFTGTVSAVMVDSLRNIKFRHMEIDEIKDHVVICGWNSAAELIIEELLEESDFEHFVVVTEREVEHHAVFKRHVREIYTIVGDYTRMDVLREAGVERAQVAILLADDTREDRSFQDRDARTVLAAMLIEKLNAQIYTTVQLLNRDNETSLRRIGVEEIVVSDEYVGNIMASVVRNRGIVSVLNELLTAKFGHQFFKCPVPRELVGKKVGEAVTVLKSVYEATLIALDESSAPGQMMVNPPSDLVLEAHHWIIVAAAKPLPD